MTPKESWHSELRAADLVVLLGVICLALATWPHFSRSAGMTLWKPYLSTVLTICLALSALTRHPRRSAAMKLATGAWVMVTPFFLGVADPESYVGIGLLIIAVAAPDVLPFRLRRRGVAGDVVCAPGGTDRRVPMRT